MENSEGETMAMGLKETYAVAREEVAGGMDISDTEEVQMSRRRGDWTRSGSSFVQRKRRRRK